MSFHHWRNVGRGEKREFVCLRHGYHGETLGALAVTDVAVFRDAYDPLLLRAHLRQVLPHLYFVERSLSRQGSLALMEVPVWVLQRALQQLSRLPADSLAERVQFSVLQQRLVEAQQAMERDYWRFRDAETRYRHLLETSSEAVRVVDGATQKVLEANPAAATLFNRSFLPARAEREGKA